MPRASAHGEPQPLALAAVHRASPRGLLLALVEAALNAQRNDTLGDLVRRHPGAARWLLRRFSPWLDDLSGALQARGGDSVESLERAARVVMVWAISQLRPDRAPTLDDVPREAWLTLTAWRPMLAVACQAGVLAVPDFRDRYRRRADESAVDNLCGLWGVGSSTYYRYLERGKQRVAELLADWPPSVPHRLALRRLAQEAQSQRLGLADAAARRDWHRERARACRLARDPASAAWHALQAGDAALFTSMLNGHALELAGNPETDALVERVAALPLTPREQFDLLLARAAVQRNRHAAERELRALEDAARLAQAQDDALLLGIAQGAQGKFHEARDVDRAFACYESSLGFFRQAGAAQGSDDAVAAYTTTLVRLAWLYVLRNDPRARTVLDSADELQHERKLSADVQGLLEQTWGEYWRRAGDLDRAIAAKHRALLIFERLTDRRSVLVTYLNLVSLYGEAKAYDKAIECAGVIERAARDNAIEPAILASTYINAGATFFWMGDFAKALTYWERALDTSIRANLRLQANRAHFNLAELFYKQFTTSHDPAHEHRADAHIAAMLGAPSSEITPAMLDAARKLKAEVLGTGESSGAENRLLPLEAAIHTEAMTEIGRQRSLLALPVPPEEHARARLAIVAAYQAIARKEYEAALAHVQSHGLEARFGGELVRLHVGGDHEAADRERALAQAWTRSGADLLPEERRASVIAHLLRQGALNKSGYAELCGVSPATASKHLVTLAERGLLVQTGKGPSTRYLLPD